MKNWHTGYRFARAIWSLVRPFIPYEKRERIAGQIIELFKEEGCDTIDGAYELCKDAGVDYE